MSFMYNPFPYDDPRAVNRPQLPAEAVGAVVSGTLEAARSLAAELAARLEAAPGKSPVAAFDGYATADWSRMINLLSQQLLQRGIALEAVDFREVLKTEEEIHALIDPLLEWDREKDPTLLYGRIFRGGYEALLDESRAAGFRTRIAGLRSSEGTRRVVVVYGSGCLMPRMRDLYDVRCYFDVTPKESILRIRRGEYANLGDRTARPANQVIRRCYYADFEMAVHLRGELLREGLLDYYLCSDHPDRLELIPRKALEQIFAALALYPFRCKPVYLEGVWGGTYVKKLRNLPDTMRNCAWVFDLIPMEVSVVVEAGSERLEFPFFTFVQREGEALMGAKCVEKFGGYFPIRFNYDDSYHSTGNMSIQVHSGAQYNHDHFDELGRQDESYYVVVAGHHARTFIGFRDDADIDAFIRDIKLADKEYKPVDYLKYVSYEDSKPGLQVMIPAGTVHSSGRNQVVLEIGSLTIGSYTYKLYDYLRPDFDGKPRPIHTWHGERNLVRERRTSWVRQNIVQQPREVRSGEGWAEYIVGEHDLLYFTLRRLEFERSIEDDTRGRFHVLTLVDGERVRIRSLDHPERFFDAEYMDMVVVPADMGRYVIENLRAEPICVHKTMLKDGFDRE
ncbi:MULTISPECIES: class I mannose-6-phosphate isomerase [Alistipes]|uniref:class I mannose-6-phosphate isomerase n=1 Tax=Alistipes TaxID=239759 RepID=UPI001E49C295|nr:MULTISPECIES: class I mannose-6-phosphate isomerase [Alistipes]